MTYFGKYIAKLHLKFLEGQRSRRYICIIYDIVGIKCSQARVNNSRIKYLLGFICAFNICIYYKDSFGKIHIKFFSKNVVGRAIFHFKQKLCPVYHIWYIKLFSLWWLKKIYFKLNHRIINCTFLWPHILTYFIALNINNILKHPGRGTKYMSCIIYDTWGTRGLEYLCKAHTPYVFFFFFFFFCGEMGKI